MDEECRNCPALCETRTQVVHGYGDVAADFLFVGERPTASADELGVPFASPGPSASADGSDAELESESEVVVVVVVMAADFIRWPDHREPAPGGGSAKVEPVFGGRPLLARAAGGDRPGAGWT